MINDEFEWDDEKALANLRTHGVSFDAACGVFSDFFQIEREDSRIDYDEDRYLVTGMVRETLLIPTAHKGDSAGIPSKAEP
jgi:uncharacterized DUF497 family protein